MTRKKHDAEPTNEEDTAALAAEAARLEAAKALDDPDAAASAALSEVAQTDANVDVVAQSTPPAWVAAAKMLCPRASDGNGAWTDYFKEPLPSAAKSQWEGPDAVYSYYEGGRVLVAYRFGGWFAVMTTPPLEKKPTVGPAGARLRR